MSNNNGKLLRFSAADRNLIRKHSVGKPTGVTVELGGFELNLVPMTVEQAGEVFRIVDTLVPLLRSNVDAGMLEAKQDVLAKVVATEGPRVTQIVRGILRESALAGDLIDEGDAGEDVFEEWFGRLPLLEMLKTLWPKLVEAQGLKTMLGNYSTPPQEPSTTETAGNTNP